MVHSKSTVALFLLLSAGACAVPDTGVAGRSPRQPFCDADATVSLAADPIDAAPWSHFAAEHRAGPEAASPPASSQPAMRSLPRAGRNAGFEVGIFYSDIDLGEVSYSGGLTGGGGLEGDTYDDDETSRTRFGVRARGGVNAIGGFVHVFKETFTTNETRLNSGGFPVLNFPLEFDAVGFGGGLTGTPNVGSAGDIDFLIPYRAVVSYVWGDTDLVDIWYGELAAEVGFGLQTAGFRPAIGVALSALIGGLDGPNTSDIEAVNLGGFAELRYQYDDFPVFGELRGLFGNQAGFEISIGARF